MIRKEFVMFIGAIATGLFLGNAVDSLMEAQWVWGIIFFALMVGVGIPYFRFVRRVWKARV